MQFSFGHKTAAPGEARTHSLQIMRLTRCLLCYGGLHLQSTLANNRTGVPRDLIQQDNGLWFIDNAM